jgi:hypothetical protein
LAGGSAAAAGWAEKARALHSPGTNTLKHRKPTAALCWDEEGACMPEASERLGAEGGGG